LKNHYRGFDSWRKVEQKLHPHVKTPLQGIKHVHPNAQVMGDIAPDLHNNQKMTYTGSDTVLSPQVSSNPNRTTDMHYIQKRNDELWMSAVAIVGVGAFIYYIKMR
jgi:hypothetical protein